MPYLNQESAEQLALLQVLANILSLQIVSESEQVVRS